MAINKIMSNFENKVNRKRLNEIAIWMPGPIRKDKGIENLNSIIKNISNDRRNFRLIINEDFKNFCEIKTNKIEFVNSNLDNKAYDELLSSVNIIILPYNHISYKTRTSGIFLESISANKFVLASENTWMEDELRKNFLSELVINDWTSIKLLDFIYDNYNDIKIKKNINNMAKLYSSIHGKEQYCIALKSLSTH